MDSTTTAMICAGSIFAGAMLGMGLQGFLPRHHLSKEMQDLVKVSAGTIATLTALVLGLLVSSAKSAFDTINTGIVQGSAKYIILDHTLARYGPETTPVREDLKHSLAAGIEAIWPTEKPAVSAVTVFERGTTLEAVQEKLHQLTPKTDSQRQAVAQAEQVANELSQTRWLLVEESQNELPLPLLQILVFWLVLLFVSFGLFAPRNFMAAAVLLVGACAISAAVFLVLELNRPFDGIIKVSSSPLRSALKHMGE